MGNAIDSVKSDEDDLPKVIQQMQLNINPLKLTNPNQSTQYQRRTLQPPELSPAEVCRSRGLLNVGAFDGSFIRGEYCVFYDIHTPRHVDLRMEIGTGCRKKLQSKRIKLVPG